MAVSDEDTEDEAGTLVAVECIDWDEERRKNGMDDGVKRLDCPRRIDEEGLMAPCTVRPELVFTLALESVPARLGMATRSGVFEEVDEMVGILAESTDDIDARDACEPMALGW